MNYHTFSAKLTGRNAVSRKLANNTKLYRLNDTTIAVKLHNTDVITYHEDGRIVFDSGGWKTPTTKERMNTYSPARVCQSKGMWDISIDHVLANYADGIIWDGKSWLGYGDDPKQVTKLVKRVKQYTDAYMLALDSGSVPVPNSGDCWGCLFKSSNGNTIMGGSDHVLSHIDESYYVPSLLLRAIERFPVSQAARAYLSDKWAGTSNGAFASIGREQIRKSIYRWVKAELGIAA